jgi:hypothetical protein
MLRQMVVETAGAASEAEPAAATLFAEWSERRSAQMRSGALALEVGHLDLLALPPRTSDQ